VEADAVRLDHAMRDRARALRMDLIELKDGITRCRSGPHDEFAPLHLETSVLIKPSISQ